MATKYCLPIANVMEALVDDLKDSVPKQNKLLLCFGFRNFVIECFPQEYQNRHLSKVFRMVKGR